MLSYSDTCYKRCELNEKTYKFNASLCPLCSNGERGDCSHEFTINDYRALLFNIGEARKEIDKMRSVVRKMDKLIKQEGLL